MYDISPGPVSFEIFLKKSTFKTVFFLTNCEEKTAAGRGLEKGGQRGQLFFQLSPGPVSKGDP